MDTNKRGTIIIDYKNREQEELKYVAIIPKSHKINNDLKYLALYELSAKKNDNSYDCIIRLFDLDSFELLSETYDINNIHSIIDKPTIIRHDNGVWSISNKYFFKNEKYIKESQSHINEKYFITIIKNNKIMLSYIENEFSSYSCMICYEKDKLPVFINTIEKLYEIIDNAVKSKCNDVYCKIEKYCEYIKVKIGFTNRYIEDTLEYTLTKIEIEPTTMEKRLDRIEKIIHEMTNNSQFY